MKRTTFAATMAVLGVSMALQAIIRLCAVATDNMQNPPWGNNRANVEAVSRISQINGVSEVAVLQHGGKLLAGVVMQEDAFSHAAADRAEAIVRELFPKEKEYCVAVNSPWAKKVIELGICIDAGLKNDILKKRFQFLAKEFSKT